MRFFACCQESWRFHFRFAVLVSCLLAVFSHAAAAAESARAGYSFFGLGLNFIDYEENSVRQIAGSTVDVETGSMVNIAQQSGTYVSLNGVDGFYLVSSSTLGESKSDESWQVDDITVRNNKVSFEQQRIALLMSRRFGGSNYFLYGAQYNNTEFRRFGATLTQSAADYGLNAQSIDSGTESETVLELSFVVGFERTTLFVSDQPGWRYQLQGVLGLPMYTHIANTEVSDGKTFSQNFNGMFGKLTLNYGYQFSKNIAAALSLELALSRREAIDRPVSDTVGVTEFPQNTLIYLFPGLALYWSF